MAITFHKIPRKISPSDNPLMYEFSSNQVAQTNFTFVCDIYFNNVIVAQSRLVVENGNRAHLDIREWVSALVFPANLITTESNNILFGNIKIKVTESYGINPTLQAFATSEDCKIFKARIDENRFITEDFNENYKSFKFLTNKPDKTIVLPTNTNGYLSIILDGSQNLLIDFLKDGAFLGSFEENYSADILQINLNNDLYGFPTATDAVIEIDSSEQFFVKYKHGNCIKQNVLYWINEYGQVDQYYFDHNTQLSGVSRGMGYSKPFGEWVGNSFEYNQNAGNKNALVQTETSIEMHSDYMNGSTQNWLNECVLSPKHWIGDDSYKMETASFINEDDRFEDLIAYTVKLKSIFIKNSPRL